ncbi:hypothetical protein [Gillisia sp. JM1]|uniref:hypothetical protein n=1 Tax=Gillisia sp. JM1 TaxID=1283286 RepID=UPI0003FD382E|nr:hypothetical protein [Gillisia sp. JM1]
MKINSKIHGFIDYLVVLVLLILPSLLNLPEITAIVTYALGGIHLLLTLFTNFEVGLIKVIPFKIHGWIEFIVSVALVAVAFYLGNIEGEFSRNLYFILAAIVFVIWLITDYRWTASLK